jgi:hypothetical protein
VLLCLVGFGVAYVKWSAAMTDLILCQKINCEDYLADGGEPAWCFKAGCPAVVAVEKCPKLQDEKNGRKDDAKRRNR